MFHVTILCLGKKDRNGKREQEREGYGVFYAAPNPFLLNKICFKLKRTGQFV